MEQQKPGFPLRLFLAFAMISAVGTIFSLFSSFWWVFETGSSFRVHYFLVLFAASILLLTKKNYLKASVLAGLALVNLFSFVHYYLPVTEVTNSGKILRLASINVHTANRRWDLVGNFISSSSPDIVLLTEVNNAWLENLKFLEETFPYFISKPRSDNFGIALFSKIAPDRLKILEYAGEDIPSILMNFQIGSSPCTLLGTHPVPPRDYYYSFARNGQLKLIGNSFKSVIGHKIILGDLNTPPWSGYFKALVNDAGLKDSAMGRGISVTWPAHAWWLLGLPIDHCLISPELQVKDRQVGSAVGSDHYPLLVDIAFP